MLMPSTIAPSTTPPRPPTLRAITSVRFFAALHVALCHIAANYTRWGPFAGFIRAGYTGVSFFFVLSGFILTYSHASEYEQHRGSPRRFYLARFARIYPVYALSMLLAGLLVPETFSNPLHLIAYAADFLMIQAWSIRMVNFFNVAAWTLSCEAVFYLLFPWLILRLKPATRTQALAAITALWLLAMLFPTLVLARHFGPHLATWLPMDESRLAFTIRRIPLFAIPEFLAGMSIGWLYLRFPPSRRAGLILAATGTAATCTALLLGDHLPAVMLHNGLLIPAYAAVILGLSTENPLTRTLCAAPLVLLGESSYVFYLFHFEIDHLLTHTFHAATTPAAAAWKLLIMIPFSVGLYLAVERPARRAILEYFDRERYVLPDGSATRGAATS